MKDSGYPPHKTDFVIKGFTEGFHLGYEGPLEQKDTARNLLLRVGNKKDLWSKVMKEVSLNRYAGPYETIPFKSYVQSPIGLVPKADG